MQEDVVVVLPAVSRQTIVVQLGGKTHTLWEMAKAKQHKDISNDNVRDTISIL